MKLFLEIFAAGVYGLSAALILITSGGSTVSFWPEIVGPKWTPVMAILQFLLGVAMFAAGIAFLERAGG